VRTVAVVPCHNRRALLVECLGALAAQSHTLDEVLVIDNASRDGSGDAAREWERVRVIRLDVNTGSAGAYSRGIAEAAAGGADWIWLLDDDAEPEPDALELLLRSPVAADPGTAALCGTVLGPDGRVDVLHRGLIGRLMRALPETAYAPGSVPCVDYSSFTGMLVRGDVARAVDPPRADFFIWGDDVEYSVRLRKVGAIRLVPESRVLHKAPMGDTATRRSRFWNRVLGVRYGSAPLEEFWKNLQAIRNFTWTRYRHGDPPPGTVAYIAGAYAVKSLLYDDRPLRRLPWIVRAAVRGWRDQPLGITAERWAELCRRA
jgi:GT2 family glycosyltransferase